MIKHLWELCSWKKRKAERPYIHRGRKLSGMAGNSVISYSWLPELDPRTGCSSHSFKDFQPMLSSTLPCSRPPPSSPLLPSSAIPGYLQGRAGWGEPVSAGLDRRLSWHTELCSTQRITPALQNLYVIFITRRFLTAQVCSKHAK